MEKNLLHFLKIELLQWSHECIPTIQSMLVINSMNPLADCHISDVDYRILTRLAYHPKSGINVEAFAPTFMPLLSFAWL